MDSAREHLAPFLDLGARDPDSLIADLEALERLLGKWQPAQNLVSRETLAQFWSRHVADSLQALAFIPDGPQHIIDMGSGGGFPALPLAIALKESEARFSLVESNSRKCAFLRTVVRELVLTVKVFSARLDSGVSRETGAADVITARALAPLGQLCIYAAPFCRADTLCLFHKGAEHVEEIASARADWDFDVVICPSKVDPAGALLAIRNLRPKPGH